MYDRSAIFVWAHAIKRRNNKTMSWCLKRAWESFKYDMAKRHSALTPLWKRSNVKKLINQFGDRAEWIILELLKRTGEEFVKVARESGRYIDHTGNLRSSIGYVIVRDGSINNKNFQLSDKEGTDKRTGKMKGEQLALDVAKTYTKGYVLIGVAGMKYAAHVEAMENKDVISLAASKAEEFITQQSHSLFNRLM